jgi:hypothetical protein
MPMHQHEDFYFTLDNMDSTVKWATKHRTNYGSFALEPLTNKKPGKMFIEKDDGTRSPTSVTRILGDSFVLTWTENDGYGFGYIDRTEQKAAAEKKSRRTQAEKIHGIYQESQAPISAKSQRGILQRQASAAA